MRRRIVGFALAGLFLVIAARPGIAAPVVMISVDGMKPEYVFEAEKKGLKIPFLRRLVAEGTYAEGVVGVWPTVTYPSHTTLVTGVSPAEHGIFANLEFDPEHHFAQSWFWYAAQIRVPTLWQAAHQAGLVTSSIGWPATVGAEAIDYLLPEFWRVTGVTETLSPSDRYLVGALARPEGLLAQMQGAAGPYLMGSLHGDEIKTRYAIEILRRHKPAFLTLHLSSLDEADPDGKVLKILSWKAQLWSAGGMSAVVLHDPADRQTERELGNLLATLAADPVHGIARIVPREAIKSLGGFPDAAFLVVFRPGYYASANPADDLVTEIQGQHGGHGFSPEYPGMRAAFFIAGPGIARGRNLGVIGKSLPRWRI
jgi:predicted AlkP superfamily pyrophosphatase or phosphodiesterase